VVVEAEEKVADCFFIHANGVTIRNMAITAHGRHAIKNHGSGTLVEDCDLVGPHNVVYTGEANTMLTLRRCKLHGSVNNGAWIHGDAAIEDCEFFANLWEGILISDTSKFVIRGSQLHDNGRAGVRFFDESKGTVEGCTIFGNRLSGVQIDPTGHATVIRCQIHRNSAFGITVKDQGQAVADRNELSGNKNGPYEIARNARITRKNNRVR
jgi:parallel beta-helix repeat protein